MSYEIIYNKQFVKVDKDNFVPMILCGSNNCTEFTNGRERRERSWLPYSHMIEGKTYGTLDEMLAKCEKIKDGYGDREDFKLEHFCSYIGIKIGSTYGNYKQYVNFFKNGCKNAKTVEELLEMHVYACVENSYLSPDSKIERKCVNVSTSEELLNSIAELTEFYKDTDVSVIVSFSNSTDYVTDSLKRSRKVNGIKRNNNRYEKQQLINKAKEYFQITLDGNYLIKLTRNGYRYVSYSGYGKKFLTEKEANSYVKRNKMRSSFAKAEVVKITNKIHD